MNLYELAKQVKPNQLTDHESKVIWKGSNGTFAYLIRLDDVIYLRMSFSQFQLPFYWLEYSEWVTAQQFEYKDIVELWQDEKADRI